MRVTLSVVGLCCTVLVGGCGLDSPMVAAVGQLSTNADAAKTAEAGFLESVHDLECRGIIIRSFIKSSTPNVLTPCEAPDISAERLKAREALMSGLALYAQALAKMEGVSTTDFDAGVKAQAGQLAAAAKAGGFLTSAGAQFGLAGTATTAFGALMDDIVAAYKLDTVATMAHRNQAQLNTVIDALKQENDALAQTADIEKFLSASVVRQLLRKPQETQRVVNAYELLQIYWTGGTGGSQPMAPPVISSKAVNDALDKFRGCHDVVAASGSLKAGVCEIKPAAPKS